MSLQLDAIFEAKHSPDTHHINYTLFNVAYLAIKNIKNAFVCQHLILCFQSSVSAISEKS